MNEIVNRKILVENDGTDDDFCKTFIIQNEDHTLANPLRYLIMKNQNVTFCGYSIPHPSENRVNFRIQSKNQTALQVFQQGLEDLHAMCQKIHDKFEQSVVDYKSRLDYAKSLQIQKYFVNKLLSNPEGERDTLLLVEHPPVYTVGLRRKDYDENTMKKLERIGASIEYTDRGGLITFHGPGQLVAYPILNLKRYNPSVRKYVFNLEQVIIDLCKKQFNLQANRMCSIGYTGVWSNDAKIAAIGIHCKKYITYHGLALNCDIDLKWFEHIVPCGIKDKSVASLSSLLGKEILIENILPSFLDTFQTVFDAKLEKNSQFNVNTYNF